MHMKESPGTPYTHLKNGLLYVLDEKNQKKKTGGGLWVGGNCGTETKEILTHFLETKAAFGKSDGRQGYHFVLSFKPGEADEQKCYDIAKDFCREYLGDQYEYVFAVHDDKAHMHAHIIFNSVSRLDGHKYHYKDGDWERYIQPVTDRVCVEHQVSPLSFDKSGPNMSYAEWLAGKTGNVKKSEIICADVDYVASRSSTWPEFLSGMQKLGYKIREGHSAARGCDYLSFHPPAEEGKKSRGWRSYHLRQGYSKTELLKRLGIKINPSAYEALSDKLQKNIPGQLKKIMSAGNPAKGTYRRLYQAVNYYQLPNPFAVPAARVRKDMLQLGKLSECCAYIESRNLHSVEAVRKAYAAIESQRAALRRMRQTMYGIRRLEAGLTKDQKELLNRCRELLKQLKSSGDDRGLEAAEDELSVLAPKLPEGMIENEKRLTAVSLALRQLGREGKILQRILEMEEASPGLEPILPGKHPLNRR